MSVIRTAVCALALLATAPAAAQGCAPLTLLTKIALVAAPGKTAEFVPVTLNGAQKFMLLDTGGWFSMLSRRTVAEMNLPERRSGLRAIDIAGEATHEVASVNSFVLGSFKPAPMDFVVAAQADMFGRDPAVAGILAPNILKEYDVDIDFGSDTLSLLSPDHCEGKVVYWPAPAVAVIPMTIDRSWHIVVPATLDGRAIKALVDSGASRSVLFQPVAESLFGLALGTADTPYSHDLQDRPGSRVYRHRFASLDLEGIRIANPALDIVPDFMSARLDDSPPTGSRLGEAGEQGTGVDLIIGMDVLRHLHVYIAYEEHKLYVTPASAPSPPPH